MNDSPPESASQTSNPRTLAVEGVALFLFIPAVLFLFVAHPRPLAGSLALGVALMAGHRFLARPYMHRAAAAKCLWCNRTFSADEPTVPIVLTSGNAESASNDASIAARCCVGHREPAARFFAWLGAIERPLKAGIFLPLLVLLIALAAGSFGAPRALAHLPQITASFQFLVGITVQLAAIGPFVGVEGPALRVPFPAHNFFLLGVRNLLWVFRLVGVWWIVRGGMALVGV